MAPLLALLLIAAPEELLHMRDLERAIVPGTLVVFDVDNTLIEPKQMLGSDQWFYALVEQIGADEHLDEDRAVDRAMKIWNAVQADIEVRAVEADTPALIRALARRHVPMLALTARTFDVADVTTRQLRSVGIDFAKTAIAPDLELSSASSARLIDGIGYVGEKSSKGQVLVEILRRTGLRPQRVVFVDDKAKHATSVSEALSVAAIPFRAFRYGGADREVEAFQRDVAAVEYREWTARAHARP